MKIRYQLLIIFLVLGVSTILSFSLLIYFQGKNIILNQVYDHLESVSQSKKTRLETTVKRKLETMELISETPQITQNINRLLTTKENGIRQNLDSLLNHYTKILSNFSTLTITDLQGKVLSSSNREYFNIDYSDNVSFQNSLTRGSYLDNFYYGRNGELYLTAGMIIKNPNSNMPQGILIAEMSAKDFIDLTNDYTGLGRTGETVLAKQFNQTVFLTPTRFNKEAALNISLSHENKNYVINKALEGKEGIVVDGLDYRDQEVIASLRFLEDKKWAIVTKMDKSEAFYPIKVLRNFLIFLNLGFVIIAFLASTIIGHFLARPVEELTHSINRLKQGDLSYRSKVRYNNELGVLSESFNEMADRLENQINELDKVGYIISHDLRAPLNSIIPLVDFIKEENGSQLNEEGHKMLDMIKNRSLQMNDLIQGILQSARTEKKIKENIDVDSLVSMITANLNPPAHIQIFIQHNLPVVHYNRVSLMQVFQNLIQNAIKFMDKEKGIINIGYSEGRNEYKFWIQDNGPGIPENKISHIFNMYETAPTESASESTGIGLGVAKKIIYENNGEIWVESEVHKGSVFYFTIPKY